MNHLETVKMTYYQHFKQTMHLLITFQRLSAVAIIHGLFPDFFTTTISKKIRELDKEFRLREAKLKCCNGNCSCH